MENRIIKHDLLTLDGLTISVREITSAVSDKSKCVLVVPGFAQHSTTHIFSQLCTDLSAKCDVFCIDPRGTGLSGGRYGFGFDDYIDIMTTIKWLKTRYEKIDVLGFSIGAYSSLRSIIDGDYLPDKVFLVSCPTNVSDIILSGAAFRHSLSILRDRSQLIKERALRFNWGNPLRKMPKATSFLKQLKMPIHFLAGSSDLLVPPAMSKKVFDVCKSPEKTWTEFPRGLHAEKMYFQDPKFFNDWLHS